MDEVTDEPLYRDRACGIDIGPAAMMATIRMPTEKDPARRLARGAARREITELGQALEAAAFVPPSTPPG